MTIYLGTMAQPSWHTKLTVTLSWYSLQSTSAILNSICGCETLNHIRNPSISFQMVPNQICSKITKQMQRANFFWMYRPMELWRPRTIIHHKLVFYNGNVILNLWQNDCIVLHITKNICKNMKWSHLIIVNYDKPL